MSRMKRAYGSASRGVREKLAREAPADEALLRKMHESDTLVVRGQYDHAQDVLRAMEVPFLLVEPGHVGQARLRPEQAVLVNCPGQLDQVALGVLRAFVEQGGYLVTTDWALRHVLEPAFPGYVAYNQHATGDDVVRVEVLQAGARLLGPLLDPGDDPQWWLEGSSYPVRVLDPARVEVLLRSSEMAEKYGEAAIAVRFACGLGTVFHIVSHYYLQRTALRTRRQRGTATGYWAAKGLEDALLDAAGLQAGEVESAYTSASLLNRMLLERQRSKNQAPHEPTP
jgi:hypothetical protein